MACKLNSVFNLQMMFPKPLKLCAKLMRNWVSYFFFFEVFKLNVYRLFYMGTGNFPDVIKALLPNCFNESFLFQYFNYQTHSINLLCSAFSFFWYLKFLFSVSFESIFPFLEGRGSLLGFCHSQL